MGEHYRPSADDRIQLDPQGSRQASQRRVGPSTRLATSSATCSEPLMRSSSTCFTTLQISSTRLLSCLRAGLAPRQNLKVRRVLCWLRERRRASDLLGEFLCVFINFSVFFSNER